MLTRRGLLGAAAVVAATAGLSACTDDAPPAATPPPGSVPGLDPASWDSLRAQFELGAEVSNFAAFVLASHPASVRAAISTHRAGLDRDPYHYLAEFEIDLDDAVLAAAASYLRTRPEQIALTDSTTMGLGLLYSGLALRPGDHVLTTEHDFYSTHESLRLRAERDGVTVRWVRLYDEPERARADDIVARLRAGVTPATRAVALTWVHSSSGAMMPVRAIADMLASINQSRAAPERILLCVDGVHGFAADAATPDELGCDFLVSGCHKWLFGPRGTGLVWGREEAWARYTPVIPSFAGESIGAWLSGGGTGATAGAGATPGGYHSFEHRWALAQAFELHLALTRQRVAARTRELAAALKEGLAGIPGVRLRTPRTAELSAGIVCCEVQGVGARKAMAALRDAKVLASVTPYATSYLRFGTSVLNSESDVDAALVAVRRLA